MEKRVDASQHCRSRELKFRNLHHGCPKQQKRRSRAALLLETLQEIDLQC